MPRSRAVALTDWANLNVSPRFCSTRTWSSPLVADQVADHLDPLGHGEELPLVRVVAHGHDQLVEQPGPPADHVQVAVGDRVELPGEDADLAGAGGHAGLRPSVVGAGLRVANRGVERACC